jgi:hypothetical protein
MRQILAIVTLMCGLALAAACTEPAGSDLPTADRGAAPSSSPSTNGDAVAFTRCMRQHGIDMPDPNPDIQWGQLNEEPEWDGAFAACRDLLPRDPEQEAARPSAEELEQLRAFAGCMREHDIELSDPDPNGNLETGGRLADLTKDQLANDSGYRAAYEACRDELPASERNGTEK